MKYFSTAHRSEPVTLRTAVLRGMPEDGGLYMPEDIPPMPAGFFENMHHLHYREIATSAALTLFGEDLPAGAVIDILDKALDFDIPLAALDRDLFILELFHGPTLAFKDAGARFMAQLMGYYSGSAARELTILTATSGDTGSAVADAFHGVEGIRVVLLYPSGKVSHIQEQQITTQGANITALEIDGSFDDCQKMVKAAFGDPDLRERMQLTSANSINVARFLPQSFYYFYACAQLRQRGQAAPPVISVPSGNLGNLTAGLIAGRMGLPVKRFIAACNANDSLPRYLRTGKYEPHGTVHTISNAMDVGAPSNFARIEELYGYAPEFLRRDLYAAAFSDDETRDAMRRLYHDHGYITDPHGAVAICGIEHYREGEGENAPAVALGTAHPAKFRGTVERTLEIGLDLPQALKEVLEKEKSSRKMPADFKVFKEYLIDL
jgi:threonine synthase